MPSFKDVRTRLTIKDYNKRFNLFAGFYFFGEFINSPIILNVFITSM
jgi:hypothetical protein